MSDNAPTPPKASAFLYPLSVVIVLLGLMNAVPSIPGLDASIRSVTGLDWLTIRLFPTEWFYPIFFSLMMICVALRHSIGRAWYDQGPLWRNIGRALDWALVIAALTISLTYLVEIESICLVDQITGERQRLIGQALEIERELATLYGLPEPKTVDDPKCIGNTGGWLVLIIGVAVAIFLAYNVKVWGFPLVAVAMLVSLYTLATILVWYFHGPDDINKYLVTILGGEPRSLADGRATMHDILVNNASGILGRFLDIMLNTVFPYLVLGCLFGASAGGHSMIKLAFRWTRKLRAGPAHAAIVSSALFGTISGGPIVNVLSTGVLTIPMMIKRGFSKVFAGGVEAAASSGGSIMPPVMGVAAFILASLTVVPYSEVIVAAILPAFAFFLCLFLSAVFQARKQNIQAIGDLTDDMLLDRQDFLNLLMIFGPILLILALLVTSKETVGCGFAGGLFGAERVFVDGQCEVVSLSWYQQLVWNSAGDAGSAGWWAVILLLGLLFVDPKVRQKPRKILDALSDAGRLISTLYLMFLAVSVIDFCLQFTGLPTYISLDVLGWLRSMELGQGGSVWFQLIALLVTMLIAILLGMGMPAVPAYINVALLMGPVLAGLGISTFTAHMFIFYFAVASAITPPVAVAAFAAASITKAEPMATGFSAVKSGVVMFAIPFVFALHPEILLIEAAFIDPTGTQGSEVQYLQGYDGKVYFLPLMYLLLKVVLALFLLASALARFDTEKLKRGNIVLRLVLAGALISTAQWISLVALIVAIGLLAVTYLKKPNPTHADERDLLNEAG
ncbi:TRAP transporter, 4TM/12TM fusion protein [Octadecabacter temperatus]|uniref:DctM-like transporter n=1 Tax=Octadecabacter temperatus TaxID=1458307 RepID=A0A0K0Y660_9RHOB|nr:TRAP transporter fused permease subunit [Octadecabacter temperatus]AKS46454.1 DctM-like transporter [Octadecabacter temperatus]SIO14355.1 TRAP transporter, 4TM/12TM fusion protein [Octadecabacter temperatus]